MDTIENEENITYSHESCLYPNVYVDIRELEEDSLTIVLIAIDAMKAEGVPSEKIQEFASEALYGNYYNATRAMRKWINVDMKFGQECDLSFMIDTRPDQFWDDEEKELESKNNAPKTFEECRIMAEDNASKFYPLALAFTFESELYSVVKNFYDMRADIQIMRESLERVRFSFETLLPDTRTNDEMEMGEAFRVKRLFQKHTDERLIQVLREAVLRFPGVDPERLRLSDVRNRIGEFDMMVKEAFDENTSERVRPLIRLLDELLEAIEDNVISLRGN